MIMIRSSFCDYSESPAVLVPDMAMVKVIIRSLGLILPVSPLSKALKTLRRTISASHLKILITSRAD